MAGSLNIVNLRFRYQKAVDDALRKVDLNCPAGSFTAIMGPTGAGKSTLLMTLNGVIPQVKEGLLSGQILLDGTDLADFRVQTITEFVGLVLQDPESQILGRTVAEDVAFGPRNHLIPRAEILRRIETALAQVGLSGFEQRHPEWLSGGQLQRVAIAGILAMHPQVLCLDEATSELDPEGRAEVYAVADALRAAGCTIIAAEHASADIVQRADQLVVLDDGAVTWQGRPADFFRDPELVATAKLKPVPTAGLGAALAAAGLITKEQIPLTVDDAEHLIRALAGQRHLPAPEPPHTDPPASTAPAMELRAVHHGFTADQQTLTGIDLTIGRGEFVAMVGRNGAGKTTLVRHFNGSLHPTGGQVLVNGRDIAALEPWQLAAEVGHVFQNPDHQIFNPTVADEVGYGLKQAGLTSAETEQRVGEVLEMTGLSAVRDDHPFVLGKGERQRLAMASILALRPGILVIDEPTTGQDWAGIQSMLGLVAEQHAAGATIIMITHDMDLVAQYANRVIVLAEGRVLADGPTAGVLAQHDLLARAGLGTTQTIELCRRLWPDSMPLPSEPAVAKHLVNALTRTGAP